MNYPFLTQKERDIETDLDYFGARYYSSIAGRFTGVDPAGPDLMNPQSLNRYSCCLNKPLRMKDNDGRYGQDVHEDLTRILAYAAGFSLAAATRIGKATQAVDHPDDPRNPFGSVNSRELYHFTTKERRQNMSINVSRTYQSSWREFPRAECSFYKHLGEYLHATQDSYSHQGFGPVLGQATEYIEGRDPYAPDYTDTDPDKANKMARVTFEILVGLAGAPYVKEKAIERQGNLLLRIAAINRSI